MRFFRGRRRLRPIGETEAYGRTYGDRTADVKVSKSVPRRPRYDLDVSGEKLREAFADRLAKRDAEKEA